MVSGPSFTGPGYDGNVAINSSGLIVNGAGTPIQLRGGNMAGLDSQPLSGVWNTLPWGNMGGGLALTSGPNWANYATFKPNVVRIILNAQSFLGLTVTQLGGSNSAPVWQTGTTRPADPNGLYRATLKNAIDWCRHIGVYIILDCHRCAPQFTDSNGVKAWLGAMDQSPFIDYDSGMMFWTQLVQWLQQDCVNPATGTINDILFELYNEPYMGNASVFSGTLTPLAGQTLPTSNVVEYVMKNGGYCNYFYQQGTATAFGIPSSFVATYQGTSYPAMIAQQWQIVGYQQLVTAIRALGATNICLTNGDHFAGSQQFLQYLIPDDSTAPTPAPSAFVPSSWRPQIATGWHPYPTGNPAYPNTADQYSGTAQAYTWAQKNIAGSNGTLPTPVIVTETGTSSGPSNTNPDPYITQMQTWLDSVGGHMTIWCQNVCGGVGAGRVTYGQTEGVSKITVSGSISGTTLTVTAVSGGSIQPGLTNYSGFPVVQGTFVTEQVSGTPGGAGTYLVNYGQSATFSGGSSWCMLEAFNGQGLTNYTWMTTHA